MATQNEDQAWRKFQTGYLLSERKKDRQRRIIKNTIIWSACFFLLAGLAFMAVFWLNDETSLSEKQPPAFESEIAPGSEHRERLSMASLNNIIAKTDFIRTDKNLFFVDTPKESFQVTTTIDVELQQYLLSLLAKARKLNRGKPQQIALVVMDATTGKIIGMSGFDLDDPLTNPCTVSEYPAASIFKIITAAAAVQELGYTQHTQLYFNGNKYTLYKRQLKETKNKYSYKISFSRAFAESVNPVFGKIGKNYLGKENLVNYAHAFGFNEKIDADLPFESGVFSADGNEYHLAELGSGFNTDTTISPVFGALLVTTLLNSGELIQPRVVEHVTDAAGEIVYKSEKSSYKKAILPKTADTMLQLMMKTVSRGTARKTFRGASRDKTLSKLLIGGKTGSLYNQEHTVKYDWFTGFGKEKNSNRKIAISIMVGHRKYIGTRAAVYAKLILKQYFNGPKEATAQL